MSSANIRRAASTSAIQRSHGAPCERNNHWNSSSAAISRSDAALWLQLARWTVSARDGNCFLNASGDPNNGSPIFQSG
jgi:hypothetical protein